MRQIIIRPLITEKTFALAGKGWFTFVVNPKYNRHEIAADVERLYKVNVTNVRTVSMHGKTRRVGKRSKQIAKADWKKAMVQLAAGQKIEAFETTGADEKKKT